MESADRITQRTSANCFAALKKICTVRGRRRGFATAECRGQAALKIPLQFSNGVRSALLDRCEYLLYVIACGDLELHFSPIESM